MLAGSCTQDMAVLFRTSFTVKTDQPLTHTSTQPTSRRQVRWSEYLQQFDLKVEFKSGVDNPTDSLSRLGAPEEPGRSMISMIGMLLSKVGRQTKFSMMGTAIRIIASTTSFHSLTAVC
jgi:hypothetical protein